MNRGIRRREFLRDGALAAGAVACGAHLSKAAAGTASADSRIDILLDEPLGAISPNIYGHFTEHLGGVIYDGLWVGENSPVANLQGLRKRLVEEMRKIKRPWCAIRAAASRTATTGATASARWTNVPAAPISGMMRKQKRRPK